MAPTFVALLSVLSGSLAYPSFRYKIPNGERVPCPEGAEGCTWTEDDILGLQGSWRCNGLGHSTCAGGGALNAFGVDFVAHTFDGCADAWEDITPGEAHKTDAYYVSCDEWSLSGWAPGRDLFYLAPEQASKSITGLKAFAMQVHYDNRNNIRNVVDRSGFRLHYSTRAREAATGSVIGQRLSYSNALQIPAGASRWFLTQRPARSRARRTA
ncbi:hypothetical protein SO694_00036041 [Aureococcus anophagefferens]|uniref:Uncharacterized protein n=1 Tax=Aureococcus anophagefferens TaxID=44056 RepID=A0ABR1FL99_AURAN